MIGEKGGEVIDTKISPFAVSFLFSPGEEGFQGAPDGELIRFRQPAFGSEVEDEAVDGEAHGRSLTDEGSGRKNRDH